MYSPAHYKEERPDLIIEIIRDFGFATIITQEANAPFVSHLPLILEFENEKKVLVGHCAKANPQWKHFADGQTLTAIFHGPHSYISPAWYKPRLDNVPTWNYATVHIQGIATILNDRQSTYDVLRKTIKKFEDEYETGWGLPEQLNPELDKLVQGIVAFKIEIQNVQAKFKLSQKQEAFDRDNVIDNLSRFGEEGALLADYMKRVVSQ